VTKEGMFSLTCGGGASKFKKTKERVMVKGKPAIVFQGPRGGKYIKRKHQMISLSKMVKS